MSSTKQQIADAFSLMAKGLETGAFAEAFPVGLTVPGSEHGEAELIRAAKLAAHANPGFGYCAHRRSENRGLPLV